MADPVMTNPIGKVARLFNPRLVKLEDRVDFLNRQLMTLAIHKESSLKFGMGARGVRYEPTDAEPSFTVDLGSEYEIDSLFLVPLQSDSDDGGELFPRRFKIDFSTMEDFSERQILFSTGDGIFPGTGGKPVKFSGQGAKARYVRLTVSQGHLRGRSEVFGLSELVVISDGYPVSFGRKVESVGSLTVKGLWYPETLTDGRMPLGSWQSGNWAGPETTGEVLDASKPGEVVTWEIKFEKSECLDLLVLFPSEVKGMFEASILPEQFEVQIKEEGQDDYRTIHVWQYPVKGLYNKGPLVIDLKGASSEGLRIKGCEPSMVGGNGYFGVSEIQIWSGHQNIARDLPVQRDFEEMSAEVSQLTDGYASEREIIPVGAWLTQLYDRWRIEREIEALQPMRSQMAAESELNATWGSALMLGLTFLIPVFIVERRRLISRNQIDQLRKRIASDLHDDIGSNLGSISLIARTAKKDLIRLHGPEEVGEDLAEVESIASESSLAMRDIVWLLERKQDSIGDLVQRMRETATRLLREVDYTIECDSGKAAAKLSLDAKRHLFLFYKEAVHNILKHSGATKVSIRLWDEGDKLALEVTDNGHGLPKITKDGKVITKPVRKLDERARVLEGELVMSSELGKGTRVLLIVKRSQLMAAPTM